MGHQPTVRDSRGVLGTGTPPAREGPVVRFDQIIFTSLGGMQGQGYQVVSASSGVRPEEKRVFGMWSPSHRGLSRETSHVVGVSFYPLPTGRFCVSRSCHVGMEPSGRGGLRVYTLGLLFDQAGLEAFSFNPLAIVRALGKVPPNLRPPPRLQPLELSPGDGSETLRSITRCCGEVDVEWLRCLLERALCGDRLVVRCKRDSLEIIETILTALPGPMRGSLSFCADLKFSLGRHVCWTVSDAPQPNLSRVLSGQGVTFIDLPGAFEKPPPARMIWAKMAELSWRNRAAEDLLWLNQGAFAPRMGDRLAALAERMMRVLTARITDFDGLLALAADGADMEAEAEDERAILDRFWSVFEQRLWEEVERGGALGLERRTEKMIALMRHHPLLLDRLGSMTVEMLTRWALADPLAAARAAVRWCEMPALRRPGHWTARLEEEIFSPLDQCTAEADENVRAELSSLLSAWVAARGETAGGASPHGTCVRSGQAGS